MTQRHWLQNERMMFITTNVVKKHPIFLDAAKARIAVDTIYAVQQRFPFFLHAFVIMPDHCHFLLRVPKPGYVSRIMQAYKKGVSFEIAEGPIWQSRFDCRIVKDHGDVIQYIHSNPINAGFCSKPEEYPWSSASGKWDVIE